MLSNVYFMFMPVADFLYTKIGISHDTLSRLDTLATIEPVRHIVSITTDEQHTKEIEKYLHEKLSSYRRSGEWFRSEGTEFLDDLFVESMSPVLCVLNYEYQISVYSAMSGKKFDRLAPDAASFDMWPVLQPHLKNILVDLELFKRGTTGNSPVYSFTRWAHPSRPEFKTEILITMPALNHIDFTIRE